MAWIKAAAAALLLLASTAAAHAQPGRWLRTETPQFIVYSDGSERAVREAVADLESFDALMRIITGVQSDRPQPRLDVYLFSSPAVLDEVRPGISASVAGFYSSNVEAVAIFALLGSGGFASDRHVLFHEYAHHFAYQYFPTAYPPWYAEGFAEFVATADLRPGRTRYGLPSEGRVQSLAYGTWLSLETILTANRRERINTDMFYAQSWALAHYIISNPQRQAAFHTYSRALQTGGDPVAAFSEAFGVTPGEMQRSLRAHVRRLPYTSINDWTRPAPTPLTFTRLPASSDEILPLAARLRGNMVRNDEEARALLAQLRTAAARAPDDPLAQVALARAELRVDDYARARAALEPVLATNPNLLEANYLMGLTYIEEVRLNAEADARRLHLQARRYLTRAANIDRRHAPTLYRYAQAAWTDPEQSENAFDVLLEARALAPQVSDLAIAAAVELMRRDRYADAAALLRPIAYDAHASEERTAPVRALLERAERRESPDAPPEAGQATKEGDPAQAGE